MLCPVCGKTNTTGVEFPSESSKFIRYCLQLQLSPKEVDRKKSLICFDHFDPKDHIKEGDKVTGVTRLAIPRKTKKLTPSDMNNMNPTISSNTNSTGSRITLDQILAQNLGLGITTASSPQQFQSTSMFTQNVNFNFQNSTSNTTFPLANQNYEMGIFGFPRTSMQWTTEKNNTTNNLHGTCLPQNTSRTEVLNDLIKRTLVLYRHRKSGSSPAIDQKYFKEWILTSFNLPEKAIAELAPVSNIQNFTVVYMIFDEKPTLDSVLQMYHSASPNSYQCVLNDALTVLNEGASIVKRIKYNGAILDKPTVDECFRLLLQPEAEQTTTFANNDNVPRNFTQSYDDAMWKNIAAEMMPVFRNLITATTSNSQPIQATNLMNTFGALNPQIPSPTTNIFQHIVNQPRSSQQQ